MAGFVPDQLIITMEMVPEIIKLIYRASSRYRSIGYLCKLTKFDLEAVEQDAALLGDYSVTKLTLVVQILAERSITVQRLCEVLKEVNVEDYAFYLSYYDGPWSPPESTRRNGSRPNNKLMEVKQALRCYRSRWFVLGLFLGLQLDDLMAMMHMLCSTRMDAVLSEVSQDSLVRRTAGALVSLDMPLPSGVDWTSDTKSSRAERVKVIRDQLLETPAVDD